MEGASTETSPVSPASAAHAEACRRKSMCVESSVDAVALLSWCCRQASAIEARNTNACNQETCLRHNLVLLNIMSDHFLMVKRIEGLIGHPLYPLLHSKMMLRHYV
jgi:hypothetical protein